MLPGSSRGFRTQPTDPHSLVDGLIWPEVGWCPEAPDLACCAKLLRERAPALENLFMLQVMLEQGLPGIARVRSSLLVLLGC